jgi:hypothetical protein
MSDDLGRDWMPPDPISRQDDGDPEIGDSQVEDSLTAEAKVLADVPPEPIPDAVGLPDEVPDGNAGAAD